MKKKTIVLGLLFFNLLLMSFLLINSFIIESEKNIYRGKKQEIYTKPDTVLNKEVAEQIYNTANKYNLDLMLEYYNEKGNKDYYCICNNPASWKCELQGETFENKKIYSTKPENGELRIYGFFFKDTIERYLPYEKIFEINDINLSSITIWIESEYAPIYEKMLEKMGYQKSCEKFEYYDYQDENKKYLAVMTLFFFLAVIIYAFSRNAEYAICFSQGFSWLDILKQEIKDIFKSSIIVSFSSLSVVLVILIIKFDFFSVLIYLKKNIMLFGIFLICYIVIFSLAVLYVYNKIGILDIKGKSLNRKLIVISFFCKVVAMVLICNQVSKIVTLYKELQEDVIINKNAKKMTEGIAELFISGKRLNDCQLYIAEKYLDFLENTENVFVVKLPNLDNYQRESAEEISRRLKNLPPDVYKEVMQITEKLLDTGIITKGYLESNEILLPNKERLTKDDIDDDKFNFLVPEGYDYSWVAKDLKETYGDNINFIYYSKENTFFSFDPDINRSTNGYENNLMLEVVNPKLYKNMLDGNDGVNTSKVIDMLCNTYIRYDRTSDLSAYEQIYDKLNLYDLTIEVKETVVVDQIYYGRIKDDINNIIKMVIHIVLFGIAYYILLFYTINLFVNNHIKEITIKIKEGYSFINIFWIYIFILAYQLPIFILQNRHSSHFMIISIFIVILDIFLFCVLSNYIIKKMNLSKVEIR